MEDLIKKIDCYVELEELIVKKLNLFAFKKVIFKNDKNEVNKLEDESEVILQEIRDSIDELDEEGKNELEKLILSRISSKENSKSELYASLDSLGKGKNSFTNGMQEIFDEIMTFERMIFSYNQIINYIDRKGYVYKLRYSNVAN